MMGPAVPRVLRAERAPELMTNPVFIRAAADVREAIGLRTDRGFGAAPGIDEAGRPVGILSRSDLLIHDREAVHFIQPVKKEPADRTRVSGVMTPVVFTVTPDSPAYQVVARMVEWKVHHLFVVEEGGALVGVISALDVVRHLAS